MRDTLEQHGLDPTLAEQLWAAVNSVSLREFNICLFDDAVSTLEALRAHGLRTAY